MTRSTHIRRRYLSATLAGFSASLATLLSPAVHGQNNSGPKPEIMLLVGSSRSMGYAPSAIDAGPPVLPVCAPQRAMPGADGSWTAPVLAYTPTKLQLVKEALTGAGYSEGEPSMRIACAPHRECIEKQMVSGICQNMAENPNYGDARLANTPSPLAGEDDDLAHYRYWCCAAAGANGTCARYLPCGQDSGDLIVNAFQTVSRRPEQVLNFNPGHASVGSNGALVAMGTDVKFGLMTFDGVASTSAGWRGAWSFPDFGYPRDGGQVLVAREGVDGVVEPELRSLQGVEFVELEPTAPFLGIAQPNLVDSPLRSVNLGIRNGAAPYGPLVPSNVGMRLGGVIELNRVVSAGGSDEDSAVRNHNEVVAELVRGIVPSGAAPTAAALHDAIEYYRRVNSGHALYGDAAAACRDRSLVYIGDQAPSRYIGGRPNWQVGNGVCQNDGDCDDAGLAGGRCVAVRDPANPNNAQAGTRACLYPDGFPYKTSVEYASELYQAGVPVYVIGVAPQTTADENALRAIADAGSPGRGAQGRGGYYRVMSRDDFRGALAAIRATQVSGNRTNTRPLVLYPRRGDVRAAATTKQWRINSWSEVPGGGDSFWYGKIERADLACRGAGAQQDEPVARALAGTSEFSAVMAAAPNTPRRVLAREGNTKFGVAGSSGTNMFNSDGTVGAAFPESVVRTLTATVAGSQVINGLDATAQLRMIGRMMNGYFGSRGLPAGPMAAPGTRQIGSIVDSELVPITAPALPLTISSYVTYANRHRNRPTMIAAGANDGLVHVFRADTGAEVVNFVPESVFPKLKLAASVKTVNGPMEASDIAVCRNASGVNQGDCPPALSDASYRTMLVGGVGAAGKNLFGIDITETTRLAGEAVANPVNMANVLTGGPANNPHIWNITADNADVAYRAKFGQSVSRPALTHVRDFDKVRAAVIVGCGDDAADPLVAGTAGVGRCVLVLDALTGQTIQVIDNADRSVQNNGEMLWPMTGTASVWPRTGIAPAERAYIGDANGSLWRIDLSNRDPSAWKITRIWPATINEEASRLGRSVVGRPALVAQESGRLAVLFSTGEKTRRAGVADTQKSYVVSLLDYLVPDASGNMEYRTNRNWEFPLGPGERSTSDVSVVGALALFTTRQSTAQVCTSALGRIYGVHATDVLRDANGNPTSFNPAPRANGAPADDRRDLVVKPMLPTLGANGVSGKALALQLPPGRVAYGVTVADVPSCNLEGGTVTEVVMNLADDSGGRAGALRPGDMLVESVNNGSVVRARYNDSMFAKARSPELSLCLNCGADGRANSSARQRKAPFSSTVSYWGSTFTD